MNGKLISLDIPPIIPAGPIELNIIQAKEEPSFKEVSVTKLEAFAKDMLSYNKPVYEMAYLNSNAQDAITNFRDR